MIFRSMLFCFLGYHSWQYIEKVSSGQLEENVKAKIEGRIPLSIVSECDFDRTYVKKVCVRDGCTKVVDTITPKIEKIKQKYYRNIERERNAKSKFDRLKKGEKL